MAAPFVKTIVYREEVESTSDLARALVEAGDVELPLLVRADRQTRGRGRGSNVWWSSAGSLMFTLALDPSRHALRPTHEPRLALAVAVAIIDALAPFFSADRPGPVIRWPNDVEVAGRKLAGLLPERITTRTGTRLLIGIGLNVHTRFDDAPADVRRLAISLAETVCEPSTLDTQSLLESLLDRLAEALPQLAADDPALVERWAALDALLGQPVRVRLGDRVVHGRGQGIDSEGALLLATPTESHRLFGGQVLRD